MYSNFFLSTSSAFKVATELNHIKRLFLQCAYIKEKPVIKAIFFREARLLFSRIFNTKGNEKIKRQSFGFAIF